MILIIGGSGLRKVNALLNRINQPDVYNKISIIINKRESVSLKHLEDTKGFIQYSMISMIIAKIFVNTSQVKNAKHCLYLMMWLLPCLVTKNLTQ